MPGAVGALLPVSIRLVISLLALVVLVGCTAPAPPAPVDGPNAKVS